MARMLNGFQNGGFGDFVENDAACLLLIQSEYLAQMLGYSFSFAVFIGCEPDLFGLFCLRLKIGNEF